MGQRRYQRAPARRRVIGGRGGVLSLVNLVGISDVIFREIEGGRGLIEALRLVRVRKLEKVLMDRGERGGSYLY